MQIFSTKGLFSTVSINNIDLFLQLQLNLLEAENFWDKYPKQAKLKCRLNI